MHSPKPLWISSDIRPVRGRCIKLDFGFAMFKGLFDGHYRLHWLPRLALPQALVVRWRYC
jgi:hypothetical protein